ncbi:MAG: O-antigen ligase family protein [Acidimicrobiales bacterium]|nr:O-antigen ligase family protein [Acidimicrobiales bacterium]
MLLFAGLALATGALAALDVRLALAGALAVMGTIAVVSRPALGGLILVATVPVTSGLAAGVPFPLLRPSEAAILGIGALFLVLALRPAVRWNSLDWAVAAYCIGSITIGAFHELQAGTLATNVIAVTAPLQFLLLYRIVASTLERPEDRSTALRLLVLLSIPVSIIGILQQFDIGPTQTFIETATKSTIFDTWGFENYPRATSIFPNWHTFAGYLAVVILLGLARLTSQHAPRRRVETLVAVGIATGALALTQTFTSIFAVAFGTVLILRRQRAWHIAPWALVLGGIALAFFGSFLGQRFEEQWIGREDSSLLPQTVDYRIEVWTEQYFPLIGQYWPLGYGTGIPPEVDWVYTESGYLTLLLRGGVGLVIAAAFLIGTSYSTANRVSRNRTGDDRAGALCVVAVSLALIPMNVVWPYLTNSGLTQAFFVVLGLVRAASASTERAPAPEYPAQPVAVSRNRPAPDPPG